jgi:hypothetical protein
VDGAVRGRRDAGVASLSAFEDRMQEIADAMSPEAKKVVKQVLASEHKLRFGGRDDLPENFASWALKEAKSREEAL